MGRSFHSGGCLGRPLRRYAGRVTPSERAAGASTCSSARPSRARPRRRRRRSRPPSSRPATRPRRRSSTSTTRSCRAPASSTSRAGCTAASSSRPARSPRRRVEAGLLPDRRRRGPRARRRRPQLRAVVHRRPHRRRARGARRGDLRRGDGPPDLARHPRPGPDAPRRGSAGVAGDGGPIEIARIIARRLGLTGAMGTVAEHVDGVYTGRLVGDMLHGPAKARGDQGARGPRGARPRPLLGVLRLRQRPADALAGRRPVRDQPRRPAARARPRSRAGGSATTAPAARRRGPACSVAAVAGAVTARSPPAPRVRGARPLRLSRATGRHSRVHKTGPAPYSGGAQPGGTDRHGSSTT